VPKAVAVAGAVVIVAGLTVALVRVGGPAGAVRKFSGVGPTIKTGQNRRLLSLSGSSRAQYWHVAWLEYQEHPWLGTGAGSFQRHWLRLRPAELPVLDAHSIYLETLAELGPVGLALLVAALTLPLVASVLARDDPVAVPAVGGYVAYLVHAAQDWDWELPAVTLAGLVCAAALLVLAERRPRPQLPPSLRVGAAAITVVLALAALGALAGNQAVSGANAALDRDDPARAERDARWAERLVPWSPEPWRLHGEALLSQGKLDAARRDFRRALVKDPSDWESWADLALVTQGADRREAARHARSLNPLEQVLPTGE
jgi:tetratricopeptide (TPR) repeat protein